MKVHSIILTICLIISTGCLGTGYILAGHWLVLPVFLLVGLLWYLTNKGSVFLSASSLLLVYVVLAAFGITAGLSSLLMIVACTTALVSWDLIQFNRSVAGNPLGDTNVSIEKIHLQSLALAASAGFMLALISLYIDVHFPFGVIVLLVLMTMGCLLYGMQYILKKNR